jgi:hypothetical protein
MREAPASCARICGAQTKHRSSQRFAHASTCAVRGWLPGITVAADAPAAPQPPRSAKWELAYARGATPPAVAATPLRTLQIGSEERAGMTRSRRKRSGKAIVRAAARSNIKSAAAAARGERTISRLPGSVRTVLGKQAEKVARRKRSARRKAKGWISTSAARLLWRQLRRLKGVSRSQITRRATPTVFAVSCRRPPSGRSGTVSINMRTVWREAPCFIGLQFS